MAGIYIHIPFCKQKCAYCDFHFSTDSSYADRMITALCKELNTRSPELEGQKVETLYFGGGTPSLLSSEQMEVILNAVKDNYLLNSSLEITVEANPDDIDQRALENYVQLGVNRLSMGIQSFDDNVLNSMNRSHNSQQALEAVKSAQAIGILNISVDIIYGLPNKSLDDFKEDLAQFIALEVPHISAYALTIEPRTVYHHQVKNGSLVMPDDELVEEQFYALRDSLAKAGYEHYEVSNFARPGSVSRHNSSYWLGVQYVGIGPSAHSFNCVARSWNVANNHRYMLAIEEGKTCSEVEALDLSTRYNEYVLTRLRTKWGLDLAYIKREFHIDILVDHVDVWNRYEGRYSITDGQLTLSPEGLILADGLASDLFQIS